MPARRRQAAHGPGFDDAPSGYRGAVYILMLVIVVAFGGFVWNLYVGGEAPRIVPPSAAYKVAPAPDAAGAPDPAEENALFESLEGKAEPATASPRPGPEAPAGVSASPYAAPRVAPDPAFAASGRYVAQIAALQSEPAVEAAWTRLASRAPELFAAARLDVERADLGARGTFFRVRAGYFADRANAALFCERIRQMGQDCIVVAR